MIEQITDNDNSFDNKFIGDQIPRSEPCSHSGSNSCNLNNFNDNFNDMRIEEINNYLENNYIFEDNINNNKLHRVISFNLNNVNGLELNLLNNKYNPKCVYFDRSILDVELILIKNLDIIKKYVINKKPKYDTILLNVNLEYIHDNAIIIAKYFLYASINIQDILLNFIKSGNNDYELITEYNKIFISKICDLDYEIYCDAGLLYIKQIVYDLYKIKI